MKKIKIEMEFTVGTLDEIGMGGFKVPWVDAEQDGRVFTITSGAGVGSPLLEASVTEGGHWVHAKASMAEFAPKVFDMLAAELDAQAGGEQS